MRIPIATYRLQMNPAFRFDDARRTMEYLSELGISTVYASPIFKARNGSTHGYNIIDHSRFNPELGTPEEFEALINEAHANGLGWLQDIVPNHMAYDGENEFILDVLENGRSSEYIHFFDIDWNYPFENIKGRVLAPFLGKFYGECLENGEIRLTYDGSGLHVTYFDLNFPVRAESYARVFSNEISMLKSRMGADDPDFIEFLGILYSFKNLPCNEKMNEYREHVATAKRMLWALYGRNTCIRQYIDGRIKMINGKPGNPGSFNDLDRLLSEQLFRLSFWKVASEELNYRRFFTINELISVNVENESVFGHIHSLVLKLVSQGRISGLRVDHIDGLYDPAAYLQKLRGAAGKVYISVEKILALDEQLPLSWPVQGTTGYDFLNYANGLLCERSNEKRLDKLYSLFEGSSVPYRTLISDKKRLIIGKYMAGDVDSLARLLKDISSHDRQGSDITLYGLKRALVEILAFFPVYRTYINHENCAEDDLFVIRQTIKRAKELNPLYLHELTFIEKFLSLKFDGYLNDDEKNKWVHFTMRFQQLTGPLMAKGFEDTVLYVYNRFLALNEVGGNPGVFGISIPEFHRFNEKRRELWPHTMNATSTHDTKRGEDARARLNILSEMPEEWAKEVIVWSKLNRKMKKPVNGSGVPAVNDEYFLYQSLIGHFPFDDRQFGAFVERLKQYTVKAVREAKVYTAWLKPDSDYENAFLAFIDAILKPEISNRFLHSFLKFQSKVSFYGIFNSLAQTLLKIASPGIPDFYQGTELWDLSFVDPDNRAGVDYGFRHGILKEIFAREKEDIPLYIRELFEYRNDGRIKLFLISRALRARQRRKELFEKGEYIPVATGGVLKDHVIAFLRKQGNSWALAAVPRFLSHLMKEGEFTFDTKAWNDTYLVIPRIILRWEDAITGAAVTGKRILSAAETFRHFPGALLISPE